MVAEGGSLTGDHVARWTATVASDEIYALGEGPLWDPARRRALWVDINAGPVHAGRLESGRIVPTESHRVDEMVGAVVASAAGDLLVAGVHSLFVRTAGGDVRRGPAILPTGSRRRYNDGKCDPAGAFLIGSLDRDGARGHETLLRVERDGSITVLDDDLTLSNGLAWSRDGRQMYSIDSEPGTVWVRDYDAESGATGERRRLLEVSDGSPDGMCTDADGFLWIAVHGRGQVRRFTPAGEIVGIVDVAAPQTTSVAFVGNAYDRLLITTAAENLSERDLAAYPDSGRLFLADVGVTGLAATPWTGP